MLLRADLSCFGVGWVGLGRGWGGGVSVLTASWGQGGGDRGGGDRGGCQIGVSQRFLERSEGEMN